VAAVPHLCHYSWQEDSSEYGGKMVGNTFRSPLAEVPPHIASPPWALWVVRPYEKLEDNIFYVRVCWQICTETGFGERFGVLISSEQDEKAIPLSRVACRPLCKGSEDMLRNWFATHLFHPPELVWVPVDWRRGVRPLLRAGGPD
jgi:hypothetical protein